MFYKEIVVGFLEALNVRINHGREIFTREISASTQIVFD